MYIRNGQSTGPSNDHRDRGLSISYIRPRKVARYVHREQLTQAGMNGSRRPVATVTRGIASTYCRVHDRESVNSPRFASFPLPFELYNVAGYARTRRRHLEILLKMEKRILICSISYLNRQRVASRAFEKNKNKKKKTRINSARIRSPLLVPRKFERTIHMAMSHVLLAASNDLDWIANTRERWSFERTTFDHPRSGSVKGSRIVSPLRLTYPS